MVALPRLSLGPSLIGGHTELKITCPHGGAMHHIADQFVQDKSLLAWFLVSMRQRMRLDLGCECSYQATATVLDFLKLSAAPCGGGGHLLCAFCVGEPSYGDTPG